MPDNPLLFKILILGGWLCITGCDQSPESKLDDYSIRVARVLEQTIVPVPSVSLWLQRARQNRLPLAQYDINLLDFLKLSQCQLSRTVGQHNSALGRLASPSQLMHFNRDFLRHAPPCIEHLKVDNPKLSDTIQQAYRSKKNQRMAIWWNAWTGFEEWQEFSTRTAQPLAFNQPSPELAIGLAALDYALNQAKQWQQFNWNYDTQTMEQALQQLRFSQSLGRWLKSMVLLERALAQTTTALTQRLNERPLCSKTPDSRQASILFNVFKNIYAVKIQPYISKVHRYGREITPRLHAMSQFVIPPDGFLLWLQQVEQLRSRFENAHLRHVEAWQATLKYCNLMPTQRALR